MCGIRRHGYNTCDCSYTYGDITPCYDLAQGPFSPILVTQDPKFYNLDIFVEGINMRHISLTDKNRPFHPLYWSCNTPPVEKIEPPHQDCPLNHEGNASTDKKPAEKPEPKLDPAAKKMIDETDVNTNALLRKQ